MTRRQAGLIAAGLGAALLVLGVLLAFGEHEDSSGAERLRLFRVDAGDDPKLVVFLPSEIATPTIAPERSGVKMACFDSRGGTVLRARFRWPLEPFSFELPRVDAPVVDRATLMRIARCRMTGTAEPVEGVMQGRAIRRTEPPAEALDRAAEGLEPAAEGLGQ